MHLKPSVVEEEAVALIQALVELLVLVVVQLEQEMTVQLPMELLLLAVEAVAVVVNHQVH